jgi:hydrogenase maturation factor HypF (carbamoyltransferase family)
VGFRPAVYRCATGLGLTGFVQTRTSEVLAEIQGPRDRVAAFSAALSAAPGSSSIVGLGGVQASAGLRVRF